ncbi:MAG: carboxylating nicotinate-nucleotide diphosphorylase [Rickettsiales bacterium]
MQPNPDEIERIIASALEEDIGEGDITTELLIPAELNATLAIVAREPLVCCGIESVAARVFGALSPAAECTAQHADGKTVQAGDVMATVRGPAQALLTAERTALNLLQRMCGVATLTHRYVKAVAGTKTEILDTRKTMPGLRELDKYAVRAGGGHNHRMRLDDMVLIKDNHIALAGGMQEAIQRASRRAPTGMKIVVECDTLEQAELAISLGADRLLLDNMPPEMLQKAVAMANGRVPLEASGGVNLQTVRAIAETGVDYISIGAITHSAPSVDIGLDMRFH